MLDSGQTLLTHRRRNYWFQMAAKVLQARGRELIECRNDKEFQLLQAFKNAHPPQRHLNGLAHRPATVQVPFQDSGCLEQAKSSSSRRPLEQTPKCRRQRALQTSMAQEAARFFNFPDFRRSRAFRRSQVRAAHVGSRTVVGRTFPQLDASRVGAIGTGGRCDRRNSFCQ